MKLIDLDKAIESMAKLEQEDNEAYGVSIPECFDSKRAIKALNNIPTVQAVPIEELQEIRQEIINRIPTIITDGEFDEGMINFGREAIEIIDKHIKEIEE